jgi:deoxyribonuclease-1-like protein
MRKISKAVWMWMLVAFAVCVCTILVYNYTRRAHVDTNAGSIGQSFSDCPYTYVSWNLGNFGKSKSDETIEIMAKILRDADIVAVQEVTAGKLVGAQAVARLAGALSRTGNDWDYVVSDPTQPISPGVERYAYLFKKKSVTFNRDSARLLSALETTIDREPFTVVVTAKSGAQISLFTMHAVPTAKSPIREVRALEDAAELQETTRAIFSGDFNLGKDSTDPSFEKLGFTGYINEKTSIKMKLSADGYLLKQYDNIYAKGVHVCSVGVIDFIKTSFSPVTDESLANARKLSDHLPVFIRFK